eukprot:Nitzschia sp. Nitz4//scaffold56_size114212//46322//49958//NITZ4_003946-RA/size114212-snap-gene-0.171-mRNA-1//1//CDS//3329554694//640//frame0
MDTATWEVNNKRLQCPCENFTSLTKILATLESDEKVVPLIDWLNGTTDAQAWQQQKILSCGKRPRCRFRYGVSFAIINAIRDACRPFLESGSLPLVPNQDDEEPSSQPVKSTKVSYENEFPSLTSAKSSAPSTTKSAWANNKPHPAASNFLVPPNNMGQTKGNGQGSTPNQLIPRKKNKKKVRPQQVAKLTNAPRPTTRENSTGPTATIGFGPQKEPPTEPIQSIQPKNKQLPKKLGNNKEAPLVSSVQNPENKEVPRNIATASSEVTSMVTMPHSLDKLVLVYVALFRNMLIPSTPLELHLLLRLLSLDVSNTSIPGNDTATTVFLRPVLAGPEHCRQFAVKALSQLQPVIRNLPIPLLRSLVVFPAFQSNCPELSSSLGMLVQSYEKQGLLTDVPTESITGSHAMLTVPFDAQRDSRHTYRTPAEVEIFKNREQSRDSFLYALRSYMNIKGRVFRAQEMEQAQQRVRQEARSILDGILGSNMMWFAEYYCEMLLQVGLAPVEETDQELLNIANKDKLQKLHQRFSNKASHTGKSTKKLALNETNKSAKVPLIDDALQFFPGYQEFFFLFLHKLPFDFGTHLRGQMALRSKEILANRSSANLERKIVELQVLGRFLGYMIFSPNWIAVGIESSKVQTQGSIDGIQLLDGLGLSLANTIESAYKEGWTVLAVPWITELLKMSKWDNISQTSRTFRQILGNLRELQQQGTFWDTSPSLETHYFPSMGIVTFSLERFFNETNGLPKLTSLPKPTLPLRTEEVSGRLDVTGVPYTTIVMFSCTPLLEDLYSLISQTSTPKTVKVPNKSRKLRPSVVQLSVSTNPSNPVSFSNTGGILGGEEANDPTASIFPVAGSLEMSNVVTRLVEAFFHQHQGLREICELAVREELKHAPGHILTTYIRPEAEETLSRLSRAGGLSEADVVKVETSISDEASRRLQTRLEERVQKTVAVLGAPSLHPQVHQMAAQISATRGMLAGRVQLQGMISEEVRLLNAKRLRGNNKASASASATATTSMLQVDELSEMVQSLINAVAISDLNLDSVTSKLESISELLNTFTPVLRSTAVAEDELRSLASAMFQLGQLTPKLLSACTSQPFESTAACTVLRFAIASCRVCTQDLGWTDSLDDPFLLQLVESSPNNATESTVMLLQDLLETHIVLWANLERISKDPNVSETMRTLVTNAMATTRP